MTERGRIFNIQRFSTHDGPGIRTTVFFQGCPVKCFWCQNPESQPINFVLMFNEDNCIGCGNCVSQCPLSVPQMDEGFPKFDREKCCGCGKCAQFCPVEALKLSGYETSVEEVYKEIMKDYLQYTNSGGGVTLSGGEVMLQPDFAAALLKKCKESGLHTIIETCGFAPWAAFEKVIPYTDEFYWDIKKVDSFLHRQATGVNNELILSNAEKLSKTGKNMRFRMPLIPGFNDNEDDICALRTLVCERFGRDVECIDLLRYNSLGEIKFQRIGRSNEAPSMQPQTDEQIEHLNMLLYSK
ncbi:MAG: glycyl-radical enzyme activating protein [Oscillospiraceae bacterium]|nr:glycyl-radical enzyme activating protein [Oscillospiraceae bacterium]